MFKKLLFIALGLIPLRLTAQKQVNYNLFVHSFCDNREYFNTVQYPQTIFGTRISPTISLHTDSAQQFVMGVNALREFGASHSGLLNQIDPIAYYQYAKKPFYFAMGVFPRKALIDDYPRALLTDTLNYYRPNVEGMLLKLYGKWGYETVFIDWTSRQTNTARETFMYGIAGRLKKNIFFLDHYSIVYHRAGPIIRIPGDRINDYYSLYARAGIDASHKISFFDSLSISAGLIASIEIIRDPFITTQPNGFIAEACIEHKGLGIREVFYTGQGHHLDYGDAFYKAKVYNRNDLYFTPINFKNIKGRFIYSLHYIENHIEHQQAFQLTYSFTKR